MHQPTHGSPSMASRTVLAARENWKLSSVKSSICVSTCSCHTRSVSSHSGGKTCFLAMADE